MRISKVFLGTLCKRGHDHEGTGNSLRYVSNPGSCVQCKSEQRKSWSEENAERHRQLKHTWYGDHKEDHRKWKREYRKQLDPFWRAFLSSKGNSRRRKVEIDITKEYLKEVWDRQNGKCYWLSIPLDLSAERSVPTKATLERLYPEKGYIKGNVVWASSFANLGRNKTPVDQFEDFLKTLHSVN